MKDKDIICDLIRGSIIENAIIQIIDIDICRLYDVSRSHGTYILIFEKNRRKPYVGSTGDVRKRLFQHRHKTDVNIETVVFLRTKDMEDALLLEDWLIRRLDCSNRVNAIMYNKVRSSKKIISIRKVTRIRSDGRDTKICSFKKGIRTRSDGRSIEIRKLSHNKQRDQVATTLNAYSLRRIGIKPGSYVYMIYDDTHNIVIICPEENLSHVIENRVIMCQILKDHTCPTCGSVNFDRNCKKCDKTY